MFQRYLNSSSSGFGRRVRESDVVMRNPSCGISFGKWGHTFCFVYTDRAHQAACKVPSDRPLFCFDSIFCLDKVGIIAVKSQNSLAGGHSEDFSLHAPSGTFLGILVPVLLHRCAQCMAADGQQLKWALTLCCKYRYEC